MVGAHNILADVFSVYLKSAEAGMQKMNRAESIKTIKKRMYAKESTEWILTVIFEPSFCY